MNQRRISSITALTTLLVACGGDATVVLSGNAYVKNSPQPVVGAVVGVAEYPQLSTVTDADGAWAIEVPDAAAVTPYLQHPDFVPTYTETFTTAGEDVDRVHFQMIAPEVFELLAGMLGVVPDPGKCQLSTEVTSRETEQMSLDELVTVRPHGVEDATVSLDPPSGSITYFAYGEPFDLPDATLSKTSASGGLVSTQVDPGVYTLRATHAARSFESIVVTCEPGRFINATVPRGLRER